MNKKSLLIAMFIVFIIALICGMSFTDNTHAQGEVVDQPKAPVAVDVIAVCEVKTVEPIVGTEKPAEKRTYFDVPLSHDVQDHIFAECEKHDVSPAIIIAMIERESNFNVYALGDDGRSAGLMQIQAKWNLQRMIELNSTDLFDPYKNITVGVDILSGHRDRYDGDIAKALVAYNQGSYKGTITNYAKGILNKAAELG